MVRIQTLELYVSELQLRVTVQSRVDDQIYPPGQLALTQFATTVHYTQVHASVKNHQLILYP